jgi:peptide/nickel transport system substrate-binding protein
MRGAQAKRFGAARHWKIATVLVAAGLVAAACGGGSGTKKAANTTTTAAAAEETTSTTAAGSTETTAAPGETTTTAAAVGSTATTAKKATATTAKKTTSVTAAPRKAVTQIQAGIGNVTGGTPTTQPQNIQPGGTITYAKTGDIASIDPVQITNSGASDGFLADSVYDMLVYSDVATGKIVPQTAESLTSTDALVWTLKLRPGIKFSDGTDYNADAVKFNYQRLQDPNNHANRAAQANLIGQMDVLDPLTLKITLKSKNAVFPVAMTLIPFIASPTAVKAQGASYGSDTKAVGAGPFIIKTWNRDSTWVLTRNPNYWRSPQPYVDQLVVNPIIDETARKNTFAAGQANMTFMGLGTNADELQKAGFTQETMILNGGIQIYFNTKTAPFNDIRARQAVGYAIDPVDYSKVVNSGLQEPIDSIFRHDSPFYDPSIVQNFNNPAKAQQLIDAWSAANGGAQLKFTMTVFTSTNYQLSAQYVQGKMNALKNVHMDLVTEASAQHITSCTLGQYAQACGFGNIFDDPEPTWTGLYTCNAVPSPTGWCNTQFDKDVADNQATLDPQQRINDIKDAQKQFYAEVPSLYLERRYSWVFHTPSIQNFRYADDGMPLLGEMWIKTHS